MLHQFTHPLPRDELHDELGELWRTMLFELRLQMTKATFNTWLADSFILTVASTPAFWVIVVRNEFVWEWLTYRLCSVIERTIKGLVEKHVTVCFVPRAMRRSIQFWDILRILAHKQIVGQPAPYTTTALSTSLLVATSSKNNDTPKITTEPKSGAVKVNGHGELQTNLANGRPITRKNAVKLSSPANGKLEGKRPMKYGNGALVDGENVTEVQTFQRYVAEKKAAPQTKTILLEYYRQQVQRVAVSSGCGQGLANNCAIIAI